jgi:hypothetical protein
MAAANVVVEPAVVDVEVAVDEDVPKPYRRRQPLCQVRRDDAEGAESHERLGVRVRRGGTARRDDVERDVGASSITTTSTASVRSRCAASPMSARRLRHRASAVVAS